jgi:hypothetical protein
MLVGKRCLMANIHFPGLKFRNSALDFFPVVLVYDFEIVMNYFGIISVLFRRERRFSSMYWVKSRIPYLKL